MPVHKKILAGFEYTGFALGRLRELAKIAEGQGGYATQKFEMPGSLLILLEIAGDQHFLTMLKVTDLFMDSGIAAPDIDHRPAPMDPYSMAEERFLKLESELYYSSDLRGYVSKKEALGSIHPPSLSCTPSEEGKVTKAFKMLRNELVPPEEEGTPKEGQLDLVALKKICAVIVPPSMFTGKLRLYFQAQYGTKLDEWKFTIGRSDLPTLVYSDDAGRLVEMWSGNTGLFTDTKNRHWLVTLRIGHLTIYPMVASASAEALRPLLKTSGGQTRDIIEAYILSASYPDLAKSEAVSLTIPVFTSGGYGYHFNWDGNKADIVELENIEVYPGVYNTPHRNKSTHRSISLSRAGKTWSASISMVEAVEWKNNRLTEPLAYPAWDVYPELEVFGDKWHGEWYGSNVPVYCFYNRNDLKVVRYSTTGFPSERGTTEITSSPPYFGGTKARSAGGTLPACFTNRMLIGPESGSAEKRDYTYSDTTSTYSVEGVSAKAQAQWKSYRYTRIAATRAIEGVTFSPDPWLQLGPSQATNLINGADTVTTGETGCADTITTPPFTYVSGPCKIYAGAVTGVTTLTDSGGTFSESGEMVCIIPYGDAEAVYLWSQSITSDSGIETTTLAGEGWYRQVKLAVPGGTFIYDMFGSISGGTISTSIHSALDEKWTVTCSTLVSGGDEQEFTSRAGTKERASSMRDFFLNWDTVPMDFWTRTSIIGKDVHCTSAKIKLGNGYNNAKLETKPWVFMGWA